MRIISKFKDYYDSARTGAGDPKHLYVRTTKEIKGLKPFPLPKPAILWGAHSGVILFCGKAFPFYEISSCFGSKSAYCYSLKQIEKALFDAECYAEKNYKNRKMVSYDVYEVKKSIASREGHNSFNIFTTNSFSESESACDMLAEDLHRKYETPVILAAFGGFDGGVLTLNPLLRKYDFAQVMPPHQAIQEIEMYIGSVLAKQNDPIVEIPDVLKAQAHGFNKWSFRKESNRIR